MLTYLFFTFLVLLLCLHELNIQPETHFIQALNLQGKGVSFDIQPYVKKLCKQTYKMQKSALTGPMPMCFTCNLDVHANQIGFKTWKVKKEERRKQEKERMEKK